MQPVRKLFVSLVAAVAVLTLIMIVLAPGVEAEVGAPTLSRPGRADSLQVPALKPKAVPPILTGNDYIVSSPGGNLPQIAGNNNFIAVVYELNSQIYLRAANATNGFGYEVLVDASNQGHEPKVAFKPGANLVHIVWSGSADRFIRHKSCVLSHPLPTCSALHTVATDNTSPFGLGSPDVVVDKFNVVHVVWQNSDSNLLFSARSTNDGVSWTGGTSIGGLAQNFDAAPALASAGDFLHVAFVNKSGSNWLLSYRRSPITGAYNWAQPNTSANFNSANTANYGQIFNPTIAVVSTKVFVAWDAKKGGTPDDKFGLLGALNSHSGDNNGTPAEDWPTVASHITSTLAATNTDTSNERFSQQTPDPPSIEQTLRPSVGVSGNDFVIVWDQRPEDFCQSGEPPETNGTSEIFYAASQGNKWSGEVRILANNQNDAHVDPDIVFNSAGKHIVFMKSLLPINCREGAGALTDYVVGYRGPWGFDSLTRVRLPIIDK